MRVVTPLAALSAKSRRCRQSRTGFPSLRRFFLGLVLLWFGGLGTPRLRASSPDSNTGNDLSAVRAYHLTVVVDGVRNNVGAIGFLVFNSPDGWPDSLRLAARAGKVAAVAGSTRFQVTNLPAGDYAVLVIHDENNNDKLDRDWKGMPREQWGMSNNPRVLLSAPTFTQARFHLDSDKEIRIELK